MKFNLTKKKVGDYIDVTDFVANGSFASLKVNVKYLDNASPDKFAVLVRTLDFNRNWNGEYVWVDKPAYDFLKKSSLIQGDLVLCNVGSVGIVFEVPDLGFPMTLGPNSVLCRTKDNDTIRQRFIYYYFLSSAGQALLEELSGGSTVQPKFNKTVLRNSEIDVPDLAHQDYIIRILRSLDAKISANEALSKTLEDISQTIFKSWFVDFDPVKAKMAEETPAGMDAATAALFPDSMVDSELGLIPSGWKVDKFGEVNNLLMGQSPPGETYNSEGEGLPFYQGRTDFGFRFPKQRIFCTQENRVALPGETLISVRAPVGDVNQAIEKCVIGRGVASALHNSNSEAYTFSLLKSLYPRLAYFNGEGTVFGAINRSDFNNMLIVEPPAALVQRFEVICGPMNLQIRSLFLSTKALLQLRDSLLPRLISGELQIPEDMLAS